MALDALPARWFAARLPGLLPQEDTRCGPVDLYAFPHTAPRQAGPS